MDDLISRQAAIEAIEEMQMPIMRSEFPEERFVFTGMSEALNVIKQLPSAQPEQRWIPCSERLPEDDVEVFVYLFDGQSPYIAWVCDCHWYTEDFEVEKENYPTAWMPLPDPAKLESE